MPKKKITINAVKAMQPGDMLWDTELRGFGCRYRVEGRYFVLKYSLHGRQRFYTIGKWDASLTPEQAREEAEILRGQVRKGIDVAALKDAASKIPLVKHAFKSFLEEIEAKRSRRTHIEYKRTFEKFIEKAIGNYRVEVVGRADIAKLHHGLKDTPYQANRILALLSSFFSWCVKNGHRTDGVNPCRHIEKFKESSRERFLSEAELHELSKALIWYEKERKYLAEQPHSKKKPKKEINTSTAYVTTAIRLLLLTGARCNEIMTLKWSDVDFKRKLIRLQESKTGQKTIYLSAPALLLLDKTPRIKDNPYVICGRKEGSHLVNIKDSWGEIRGKAGLKDVRIHDLRHNYASTAVASGHHLKVIGSLLGHADTQTTERYAHLANDPLQTANEAISKKILDAMARKPRKDNVVAIRQK
jgi:integrase